MVAPNYERPSEFVQWIKPLQSLIYYEEPTPDNRRIAAKLCDQIHSLEPATLVLWGDYLYPILGVKEHILEGL